MTDKNDIPTPTKADIQRAVEFSEENRIQKSLLIHLFGDHKKNRILDFLIENKGLSFTKRDISKGAHVSESTFFKQDQKKHRYDDFGDLVRLGVVKPVNNGGRAPKYQIDIKVLKARMKEVVR